MAENVEVLDLRPLSPVERHKQIFERWKKLPPGNTLKIINDHEPKPLYYQFDAEEKGCIEYVPTIDVPTGLPPQELNNNG